MSTEIIEEQRRVRVFIIAPEQFLRCLQLLREGIGIHVEAFPAAVKIVACYSNMGGRPVFGIVLEHASFDLAPVIVKKGVVYSADGQMPEIAFRLNEPPGAKSQPITHSVSNTVNAGTSKTHESRRLLNYQVPGYQIIRLLSALTGPVELTPLPEMFPTGTTLFHSAIGAGGVFSMMLEHPSFDLVDIDIERVNGEIILMGGKVPIMLLDLGEEGFDD